uniref:Uncharacterized protein n=1 Tax=Cacopsylla melanoneura TaxID=428564 RepID=A0A8D8TUJ1_9HEMI
MSQFCLFLLFTGRHQEYRMLVFLLSGFFSSGIEYRFHLRLTSIRFFWYQIPIVLIFYLRFDSGRYSGIEYRFHLCLSSIRFRSSGIEYNMFNLCLSSIRFRSSGIE